MDKFSIIERHYGNGRISYTVSVDFGGVTFEMGEHSSIEEAREYIERYKKEDQARTLVKTIVHLA